MKKMLSFAVAALLALAGFAEDADVVALRNVAVATTVGTAPTLPETVKGLNADGTLADVDYSVVWSSIDAPSAAGVTAVTGTAMVNGAPMSVTAFVRAAVPPSGDLVNIAPLASSMTVEVSQYDWKGCDHQGPEVITNGYGNVEMKIGAWNSPGGGDYRNIWYAAHPENTTTVQFAWDSPKSIRKMYLAMYDGNQHSDYIFRNGSTGEEIPATAYTCTKNGAAYYWINQGEGVLIEFESPVSLQEMEVVVVAKSTWVGFYEIEIWAEGSAGKVDPTMTDTLTALEVDGEAVTGFAAATYDYTVYNGTGITSATNANRNVAVTILPKYNGSAYAVTLAETGEQTKTYTVSMPICPHEHTTTNGASVATCTVPGSTGTETCDLCGTQIHGPEEIPATGHLHTTVTGAKEATCTEDGYTGDTVCSDCEETIESGTVIPATGHLHTTVTGAKEATCTEDGYTGDTVCSDCKETVASGTVIPATGHQHTTVTGAKEATCTEPGSTGTETCDKCGDTIHEATVIQALGHDWGAWTVTKEPSKTETGYREHTCQRANCGVTEGEVIPMLADVVALRNVAVVTTIGTAPELPAKVAGIKADGTVDGEYDVVWNTAAAPSAAGITTVAGTAMVNGAPMSVTAFVRAAVPPSGDLVNIAPLASSMTVSSIPEKSPENQNQSNITNCWAGSTMTIGQWRTPQHSAHRYFWTASDQGTIKVDFAWPTAQKISKVGIAVYDGNQHGSAALKYTSSGDPIPSNLYDYVKNGNAYYKINSGDAHLYTFKTPISLTELTVEVTKMASGTWIGIYQIEIFAEDGGGSVDPTSTDTLTALEVDSQSVTGFAAETTSYSIDGGQAITKAENDTDNVAVTILQKLVTVSDNAYVVTLAEDGESTKTYTVSMPPPHEHVYGEWQVITPATVYAPGLRRRVCTIAGCTVTEEEPIPQIARKTVKWIDVDFENYADASTIADEQVDPVDGGTWAKLSVDDTATVAHGDPDLAALVVTNGFLGYTAKEPTTSGRDAMVKVQAKFQKPNTSDLPPTLELGQTAVFVFPDGKGACYKAYTSAGWVKLTGATPDFTKFVTVTIEFRYEYGERLAMVKVDNVVCTPVGAETPWFTLAGSATRLTSVDFFGEFDLGPFEGDYLTTNRGTLMYIR